MSYSCSVWKNPIPGRKYAKCGPDKCQDRIARQRERADHHERAWKEQVNYYQQAHTHTNAFDRWSSKEYYDNSTRRYRSQEGDKDKAVQLDQRKTRLKEKLNGEDQVLRVELSAGDGVGGGECDGRSSAGMTRRPVYGSHHTLGVNGASPPMSCTGGPLLPSGGGGETRLGRLEALRAQLDERRQTQERRRREEAKQLMQKHWKLNNSILREVESERRTLETRDSWRAQIEERHRQQEARREAEEREQEERRRLQDEETRRQQQQQEESARRMDEMRTALQTQMQENRERDERLRQLCDEEAELMARREDIEEAISRREEAERQRQRQQLRLCQIRQSNSRLRQKSLDVEKTLCEEKQFIDNLLGSGDRERGRIADAAARTEANNLRNVLNQQLQLESTRRSQTNMLFNEEAESVWQKREREWIREAAARRRLMDEVVSSWRQQVDQQLDARRRQLLLLRDEQRTADQLATQQQQQIEEERQKRTETERQQLQDVWKLQTDESDCRRQLDVQQDESHVQQQRQQQEQELHRIRQELAKLHFSSRTLNRYEQQHRLGRRIVW